MQHIYCLCYDRWSKGWGEPQGSVQKELLQKPHSLRSEKGSKGGERDHYAWNCRLSEEFIVYLSVSLEYLMRFLSGESKDWSFPWVIISSFFKPSLLVRRRTDLRFPSEGVGEWESFTYSGYFL